MSYKLHIRFESKKIGFTMEFVELFGSTRAGKCNFQRHAEGAFRLRLSCCPRWKSNGCQASWRATAKVGQHVWWRRCHYDILEMRFAQMLHIQHMNYYFTNMYNLFTTFTQTSDKPKNVREPPSGTDLVMNKMQIRSPNNVLLIEFPSGFQIKHTHTHTEATFGSEH